MKTAKLAISAREYRSLCKEQSKQMHKEDPLARAVTELPDCSCGWSGKGTGPRGRFMKGDRCPECGESLF